MRDPDAAGETRSVTTLTTQELVVRTQAGDRAALEALFRRYRPRLERLVHGRLPRPCRGVNDTQDFVQNTLCRALNHLDRYDYRHEGAFLAWLRVIVHNEIIDQLRRAMRRPEDVPIPDEVEGNAPSPLEQAIGAQNVEIYERALQELPEQQHQALILRLEYRMTYPEISSALQMTSPNATRMMIARATLRLAHRMRELGCEP